MNSPDLPAGTMIETVFLVEAQYTPEAAERRPSVRAAHIARVAQLKEAGVIIEAGAYSDRMSSSVLLVRADTAEQALAIANEDVYVSAGVWGEITARTFGRVATSA